MFTIYLPSNSPGAEAQSLSEDQNNLVSSWYKTTLDGTIDLDGDGWEVGLAEICFPSKLLSLLEEFEIGIVIVNPPECFVKKVREEHLKKLQATNQLPPGDNVTIATMFPVLDYGSIYFGGETTKGTIKLDKGVESERRANLDNVRKEDEEDEEEEEDGDDVLVAAESASSSDTIATQPGNVTSQSATAASTTAGRPGITASTSSPTATVSGGSRVSSTGASGGVVGSKTTITKTSAERSKSETVNRSKLRSDTSPLSGLQILERIAHRPSEKPPPEYASKDTPGIINVDDMVKAVAAAAGRDITKVDPKTKPTQLFTGPRRTHGWYTFRLYTIALGEILPIENTLYPELSRIPAGFYSSRGELVNLLNERMTYFLNNRTYPARDWSIMLFEPFFHGRDSGMVTVSAGFFDPLTDATSPYIHLVPTINSLRALKFLGFDLSKWKWNSTLKTYVYTIPENSEYVRRDSATPIRLLPRGANDTVPMFVKPNVGTTVFSAAESDDLAIARLLINYKKLEKLFVSDFAQRRNNLLKPKTNPPQFLFVYVDVARPVAVGNTRASVLRITSLKSREDSIIQTNATAAAGTSTQPSFVRYYQNEPERFTQIIYVPVSRKSFNTITVFLSDENGSQLSFDEGTVYLVLQFRKRLPFSMFLNAISF